MPSRQDPRVTSVPVLSCWDDEKNTLVGGTIPSTNYAAAPMFQYSLWVCPDWSQFGMLRKAGWTFINLPWLESFPVHNLPSFPPPACRASLPLKLLNPWTKVVKRIKKNIPLQVHRQAINTKTVGGAGWCREHLLTWKTDKEAPLSEWPLPGFAHPGSNPAKDDINAEDELKKWI